MKDLIFVAVLGFAYIFHVLVLLLYCGCNGVSVVIQNHSTFGSALDVMMWLVYISEEGCDDDVILRPSS